MLPQTRVLVTGVAGAGVGYEIVKALRLAGRYHIVGADMAARGFGFLHVDEGYVIPPAADPSYLDTVTDLCKCRGIKAVIPGSEPELRVLSRHSSLLRDEGVLVLANDPRVVELCVDKAATASALAELGLACPHTVLVRDERDVPLDFSLPAVVKPATGGGGSNNVYLAQDPDELRLSCRTLLRQGRAAVVQEYVGTPQDEYTVGVLSSLDGSLVDSIALRRDILNPLSNRLRVPNRTGRTELSPVLAVSSGISQGLVAEFPGVRQQCEAIAKAFRSRGPLNIQCRVVGGVVYCFEVNPRFSASLHIRALMGFNEADLLLRHHLMGEPLPHRVPYRFGEVARGLAEGIVSERPNARPWRKCTARGLGPREPGGLAGTVCE